MGPTGSDVGRGTAAGYVNMQTKTPHLPRVDLGHARPSAPPISAAATFDVNQPLSAGNRDSWIGKSAVRLNALWQDSGVAGRDEVENETQGVCAVDRPRPRHLHPRHRIRAGPAAAQPARLRHSRRRLAGIAAGADHGARAAIRSIRATTTAARRSTTTTPIRTPLLARVEHDLTPRWTVSNQTRYNKTEREAVISTVQIGRVVRAGDGAGDDRPSGQRAREPDHVEPDRRLTGRFMTGGVEHNISSGLEFAREAQFAPTLTGRRHPRAGQTSTTRIRTIRSPATRSARTGAFTDGQTDTAAVYAFDSLSLGTARAGQRRPAVRALRHRVPLGRCRERDDGGPVGLGRARERQGRRRRPRHVRTATSTSRTGRRSRRPARRTSR